MVVFLSLLLLLLLLLQFMRCTAGSASRWWQPFAVTRGGHIPGCQQCIHQAQQSQSAGCARPGQRVQVLPITVLHVACICSPELKLNLLYNAHTLPQQGTQTVDFVQQLAVTEAQGHEQTALSDRTRVFIEPSAFANV